MNRNVEEEAWDIIANIQLDITGYFDPKQIRATIKSLKDNGLLVGEVTEDDQARMEEIRARDIQRRVAEDKGIMQGMREKMNVAFLLDYIDKLERRNNG